MSDAMHPELPLDALDRIDRLCDHFEAAWRAGQPPRIEDVLGEVTTADRPALFGELLATELAARRRRGERPEPHEYRERFPDDDATIAAAFSSVTGQAEGTGDTAAGDTATFQSDQPGSDRLAPYPPTASALPRVRLREPEPEIVLAPHTRSESPGIPGPASAGRYHLFGEIARGGMGAVLRARDPEIGRELALKVLLERHRGHPELSRRFQEEAQIGGQLQHPGIVPVYELGMLGDRRPYFAMKLVKGRTLAALLAERVSPDDGRPRFLAIFEQVCQTVAYTHARGVIHRDLKPSNVMVGAFGEVQVMDWGLAKVLPRGDAAADGAEQGTAAEQETVIATARSRSDSDHSRAGSVLGTPAYMAPEQARGDLEQVDERADVFALGSVLCEILTGRPVYHGRSAAWIQEQAARGETAEALGRLEASGAEAELVSLAKDCLAVEPEDRPRDARAVAERVTAYLAGVQERLHAAERERAVAEARATGERRRRRWQLGLAGTVAASLLLGAAGLAVFAALLDRQRQRAERGEELAIQAVKRFHDAVAKNPELKDNPELGSLRKALLKEPLEFFRSLRDRLQAGRDTRPESLARLAEASFELGELADEIGDKPDALTGYREALTIVQRLAAAHPDVDGYQKDVAMTQLHIGKLLSETGHPAEARAALEGARSTLQRLAAAHPTVAEYRRGMAQSHTGLGRLLTNVGPLDEARAEFEAALAIQQEQAAAHPGDDDDQLTLAESQLNFGILLVRTGQLAEARTAFEEALRIKQRVADAHPDVAEYKHSVAVGHFNLGTVLATTGHRAEARAQLEAARPIFQKLVEVHPTVTEYQQGLGGCHHNLGRLLAETGHPAEARAAYEAGEAILQKLVDAHPTVTEYQRTLTSSHINVGNLLRKTGHRAEARKAYEAALALQKRLPGALLQSPEIAYELGITLNNLGMIHRDLREFDAARDRFREAIAQQRKALAANPRHPDFQPTLRNYYENLLLTARGLDDAELAAEAERGLNEVDAADPRFAARVARLTAVLNGAPPADNAERLALARVAYDTFRPADAARLWAEALATDPKLADDRRAQHPYNAACAAALAGCGQGRGGFALDDATRVTLRGRSLGWLRGELAAWSKVLEGGDPKARAVVAPTLRHWQKDTDLVGVREPGALKEFPEAERQAWLSLWAEVAAMLGRAAADRP
jgi:serine/threonine-protein kinase